MFEPKPTPDAPAARPVALARQDAALATALLELAFAGDPGVRWMFPEADRYAEHFPAFVAAFGGGAWEGGTGTRIAALAVALWLPPGAGPDEKALIDVVERGAAPARRGQALELFDAMGRVHPDEPHWYLPLVGTDPVAQGHGLGAALLAHTLARCDAEGLPAYLEATSERSVPLYRRLGFEVLTVLRVGTCPPITPMLRRPRAQAERR
ncbi:MAG TPA: GNAT family N-acetyltransferase [Burkholderiaceae bacterium]|jgi:GNAT superfamily N-acetyltransferase|nr:GNAT family N-acetyltransferase [Burkholderiaceae bacterium]